MKNTDKKRKFKPAPTTIGEFLRRKKKENAEFLSGAEAEVFLEKNAKKSPIRTKKEIALEKARLKALEEQEQEQEQVEGEDKASE